MALTRVKPLLKAKDFLRHSFTPSLPSMMSTRSNRCLLLSKFGVRNEPWLSYRQTSFPFPTSGLTSRRGRFVNPIYPPLPEHPPLTAREWEGRLGREYVEDAILTTLCTGSAGSVGDGRWLYFTIGSLACRRQGHPGSLTANITFPCGLSTLRSGLPHVCKLINMPPFSLTESERTLKGRLSMDGRIFPLFS